MLFLNNKSILSTTLLCTLLTFSAHVSANDLVDCTDGSCQTGTEVRADHSFSMECLEKDNVSYFFHTHKGPCYAEATSFQLLGETVKVTLPTNERKFKLSRSGYEISGPSDYGVSYTFTTQLLDEAAQSIPKELILWKKGKEIQSHLSEDLVDLPAQVLLGDSQGRDFLEVLTEKDGAMKISHRVIVTDIALYHLVVDTSRVKGSTYRPTSSVTRGLTRHFLDSMTVVDEDNSDEEET